MRGRFCVHPFCKRETMICMQVGTSLQHMFVFCLSVVGCMYKCVSVYVDVGWSHITRKLASAHSGRYLHTVCTCSVCMPVN